jgi:hypothetical protein
MDKNDKRLKNLIPAKRGEVRNPKGRGKGKQNWSTILKHYMKVVPKLDKGTIEFFGLEDFPAKMKKDTKTVQHIIAARLLSKATKGDLKAIEMLLDRMEGKPTQTIASVDLTPKPLFIESDPMNPFGSSEAVEQPPEAEEAEYTEQEEERGGEEKKEKDSTDSKESKPDKGAGNG